MIALRLALAAILPTFADEVCPARCEGHWTDSVLYVGSSDVYGDDAGFLMNLASWRNFSAPDEFENLPSATPEPVSARRVADLRAALEDAARDCKRIRYLQIGSHGSQGRISFPEGLGLDTTSIEAHLSAVSCAMAPDAVIHFDGCNVARGCRGDQFLAQVARTLLPKGGSVSGNTFYSSTPLPGVIPHFSLNFDTQTLFVKAPGPEPDPSKGENGWDNPALTGELCAQELERCRQRLLGVIEEVRYCSISVAERSVMSVTRDELESLIQTYRSGFNAEAPAVGLLSNPQSGDTYKRTYRRLTDCEWACDAYKSTGPCRAGERDATGEAPTDAVPAR